MGRLPAVLGMFWGHRWQCPGCDLSDIDGTIAGPSSAACLFSVRISVWLRPCPRMGVCLPSLVCFGAIDGNAPSVTCPKPGIPHHGPILTPPLPVGGTPPHNIMSTPAKTTCRPPKNCPRLKCTRDSQWTPVGKNGCKQCPKCITGCVPDSCPGNEVCGPAVKGVRTCVPKPQQKCSVTWDANGAGRCAANFHCVSGVCKQCIPPPCAPPPPCPIGLSHPVGQDGCPLCPVCPSPP